MSHNVWLTRLGDNRPRFCDNTGDIKIRLKCLVKLALGAALIGVGIKVVSKAYQYRKKKQRELYSLSKPDVVILHQFPRGCNIPNISPFPLKLETYLRISKISYENDHRDYLGPKGKCPYITLNGEDFTDSQLIIEHLNKIFNVNLNAGLTNEQKAIGRAFRIMLEDHLYWGVAYYRWVMDKTKAIKNYFIMPFPLNIVGYNFIRCNMKRAAYFQGIGRHSEDEIKELIKKDLMAVSQYLGNKPFLFGDQITEEDCAIFGMLAQCVWTFPGSFIEGLMTGECSNLKDYCLRVKSQVWPDWERCIKPKA